MLTKRTNILFEEKTWKLLSDLAKSRDASVGELVREAVKLVYGKETKIARRKQALREIQNLRKRAQGIDYKELINYGRKY
jgi:hypothetical protein